MSNQGLSIFDHEPDNTGDEPTQVIPTDAAEQASGNQKPAQKLAEKPVEKPADKPAAQTPQRAQQPPSQRPSGASARPASANPKPPAAADRREGRPHRQPHRGPGTTQGAPVRGGVPPHGDGGEPEPHLRGARQ